ncbi:hypothetical protein CBL_20791, partial [Carabus blaptoides fortunei]
TPRSPMDLLTIVFFAIISTLSEQRHTYQPVVIKPVIIPRILDRSENNLRDQLPRESNHIIAPNWLSTNRSQDNSLVEAVLFKSGITTQRNTRTNTTEIKTLLAIKCVIPIPCPKLQCKERFTVIRDPSGCTCPRCVCILPCPACPTGYEAFNRDPSICQCPRCIPS